MRDSASASKQSVRHPHGGTGEHVGTRLGTDQLSARKLARDIAILTAYGIGFTLLRVTAANWATHKLFSVWFPAAGLRFAFLWLLGPRWAPAASVAELVVSVGAGTVALSDDVILSLLGVVGPCLLYGAVIAVVRGRMGKPTDSEVNPLAFGVAAIISPMAACVAALLWAVPLSLEHGFINPAVLLSALLVFTLGDLLGILIVAPPLLWLAGNVGRGRWAPRVRISHVVRYAELGLLLICSWMLVWLLERVGDGLVLAPVLLAACWCGLRGGRGTAWVAILLTALAVLPLTESPANDALRVQVHMQLACVAVGAYLAGSYADAQRRAIVEISRRDRLLLRAERLKTLRAMSVAVIHEVSQPLSTIAIEARALREASEVSQPNVNELREIAALIARKTDDLAELIRRLRGFGSGGSEERAAQSIPQLIDDVLALAAPEARNAAVAIERECGPPITAAVNDVEMRQALLNLIRNAIAAAPKPNGVVKIGWRLEAGSLRFWVENSVAAKARGSNGLGLGLIIARTIAQAHGGSLSIERTASGDVRSMLDVPLDEGTDL